MAYHIGFSLNQPGQLGQGGHHIALNSLGYDHGVWQLPEVFVLPRKMRQNNYFGVYLNIQQPNIQEYNYCKVVSLYLFKRHPCSWERKTSYSNRRWFVAEQRLNSPKGKTEACTSTKCSISSKLQASAMIQGKSSHILAGLSFCALWLASCIWDQESASSFILSSARL